MMSPQFPKIRRNKALWICKLKADSHLNRSEQGAWSARKLVLSQRGRIIEISPRVLLLRELEQKRFETCKARWKLLNISVRKLPA